jgi:hypothetical protein
MSKSNGANPRLDRIEGILETVVTIQRDMQQEHQITQQEHQMLLRAQVVQGEEMRQSAKRTDESLRSLAAAQERMDEALTALMGTVDEIIRSRRGPE